MRELGGSGSYPVNTRGRGEQIPNATFAVVTVFCAVTLNICASSVRNSRPVNPLELTVFQHILGSCSSCTSLTPGPFSRGKDGQGCEADLSPPFSTEVKTVSSCYFHCCTRIIVVLH